MWVIVKFEESWFYKLSYFLSSSSTHPYTSPRGLCFLTFIPDNLKSNGKQLQIHKQAASQWQSSCHPIHMARSCDNLLLWQAYDIQGSASGVLVRDLFRPSDALTAKVCLSLCAFALGETLREFWRSGHVPRRHLAIHDRISFPLCFSVKSIRESLTQAKPISHFISQTLPLIVNSYSPRQGRIWSTIF